MALNTAVTPEQMLRGAEAVMWATVKAPGLFYLFQIAQAAHDPECGGAKRAAVAQQLTARPRSQCPRTAADCAGPARNLEPRDPVPLGSSRGP